MEVGHDWQVWILWALQELLHGDDVVLACSLQELSGVVLGDCFEQQLKQDITNCKLNRVCPQR